MHQVDAIVDSDCNSLVATKIKQYGKETTQQFLAKASLLTQKWKDKVKIFQGVKHRSLELVPELGPSFEEEKEEKAQTENPKKEENMDKGKQ